jgi:capsular polysaccharide transport system permease protein
MFEAMTEKLGRLAVVLRKNLAVVIIVIPIIALAFFYVAIATHRYQSESKLVVKKSADAVSQLAGFSLPFLGALGGASGEDVLYLREYILSADLIDKLDTELNLHEEFGVHGIDIFSALPPWAKKEDFIRYFRKRVELAYDEKTGILTVRTQATSPELAQKLNQAILRESENFINELSHQIAREQNEFANQELLRAKNALNEAKERLLAYQNQHQLLDPTESAGVASRVIGELEGQLAGKEVEYRAMGSALQPEAAQMQAIRQAIGSLKTQIDAEKKKLTSAKDVALNRTASVYLEYKQLLDFQTELYKLSMSAVEKMRVESARKVKTLAILSHPQLADDAEFPKPGYLLLVWFFSLSMLFGFVRLVLEIIEDHRD